MEVVSQNEEKDEKCPRTMEWEKPGIALFYLK